MAKSVTIKTNEGKHQITITSPEMNYLGIWHIPFKEANYICIEPWTSLPSRQNVIIDIECKSDLIKLQPHHDYKNTWSITVK